MIRVLADPSDRRRVRWLARRQWRARLVLVSVLKVEGIGRTLVVAQRLETRWSDSHRRRLWRVPESALAIDTKAIPQRIKA